MQYDYMNIQIYLTLSLGLFFCVLYILLKKTIEPCPKHKKCNGFNGYKGNCIGFNGNFNGVYWYVMDSIGGMLNPIGKMPKTHYRKEFCNGFTGKS